MTVGNAKRCFIQAMDYCLPDRVLDNVDLQQRNPQWDAERIFQKTGIRRRHLVSPGETVSEIAISAVEKLFRSGRVAASEVDVLIVGSQSPDFPIPGLAHVLHKQLGLPHNCAAMDVTLGCSGFTYALWLAKALVTSGAARRILIVSCDTYSRFCDPDDFATVALFGDGAAATLLSDEEAGALAEVGESIPGTDGSGMESLMVRDGAGSSMANRVEGECLQIPRLKMNGPEVFQFALREVVPSIHAILGKTGLTLDQVDLFLMHQANAFMLEHLRRRLGVPVERMPVDVEETGNTVNASLPILLCRLMNRGILVGNQNCVLTGFGVGLSWCSTFVRWLRPFDQGGG